MQYGRTEAGLDLPRGLALDGVAEAGYGKEAAGAYLPYSSWGTGISWTTRDLRLELRGGHFGHYARTTAGYRRSAATFAVAVNL